MRREESTKVRAVVGAVLATLAYLAALAVTWSVIASVRAAVEQYRLTGEVSGPRLSEAIHGVTAVDKVWAFALVDTVVVLVCWGAWRRRGDTGATASVGRGTLCWILLTACGLQIAYLALGRVLDLDAGWLTVPAPVGAHALSAAAVPASALVLIAVLHPLATELLFRGVVAGGLAAGGLPAAVVVGVSALLAAAVQPSVPAAVLAFAFGLFAGVLRLRAGSVAPAVVAHYALAVAGIGMWEALALTGTEPGLWTAAALGAVGAVIAGRIAVGRFSAPGRTTT